MRKQTNNRKHRKHTSSNKTSIIWVKEGGGGGHRIVTPSSKGSSRDRKGRAEKGVREMESHRRPKWWGGGCRKDGSRVRAYACVWDHWVTDLRGPLTHV